MGAPPADGFIEQDARGVIIGWSVESEQLFGWTRAEAIGMRSHRLIPERNRATHDSALERFIAAPDRPIRRQEVTALHKDGHEFRAEFAISIGGSGDSTRVIAVVRRVEAEPRADADAAFRQSERFRAILDQIEDGCCVVDLRGNYLFVNDAFCRLYGYDKAEILGSNFKQSSGPERAGKLREMYNQVYTTGRPIKAFEYQILPKNRPPMFVEQSISLERDADGRAVGFLAITRDCTARKQAEEAMARAKEAAEAANRAKSEFLANMSHEIRTPMNGIIGMTALVLDTAMTPEQNESLQTIRGQAESLLTVVNDILDFSKIEQHRVELESVAFLVGAAIDEVVAPLALRARAKGIDAVMRDRGGCAAVRRRRSGPPETDRLERADQRRQVHRARIACGSTCRWTSAPATAPPYTSASPTPASAFRPRQAHGDLRTLPAGRRVDDAAVRRHRARARDRVEPGPPDGRADPGRQRSRASAAPSTSPSRSSRRRARRCAQPRPRRRPRRPAPRAS